MYFEATASARAILDEAHRRGVPAERVLSEAHVDATAIDPPALHVPWPTMVAILRAAAALTGDPALGLHAGAGMDFGYIDMAGPYALNQPVIRNAIQVTWGEVQPLSTNVIRSELLEKGDTATLRLHCNVPDCPELGQLMDFYLMSHVNCSRLVDGSTWMPRAVRIQHPAPADLSEHRRLFGCTPSFGQPANELEFDRSFLDLRFPLADPKLLNLIRPRYEAYLDALRNSRAVTLWVRNTLYKVLEERGALELKDVAKRIRMRPRTLQHKLAAEGTTFHRILDAIRRDVAIHDLSTSQDSLDAVAAKLRYSDARAFLRAFRRWTGETPGRWSERISIAS